jgi:transcriptional regulator with XRE-family HTH domain
MEFGGQSAEAIGPMLARLRAERGISQLRLAERVCAASGLATVSRHEISRWEREERVPSDFWLGWLAVALEVPIEALERAAGMTRRRRRGVPTAWTEHAPGVYVRVAS